MVQRGVYENGILISRVVAGDGLGIGCNDAFGACLKECEHLFVVVDRQVALKSCYVSDLLGDMAAAGIPVRLIDASEESKTMEQVLGICSWLLENGADRDALVLAVGGGITTDMTGFAASIYKRGVRFAYVPTTLLSQVDAAVGGKTGVNFMKYKNILGVIRQPEFTYICPQVLESLPHRDFLSGVAEMLKTFVIGGAEKYEDAVNFMKACSGDMAKVFSDGGCRLSGLVEEAVSIKCAIVSRDQFEGGERRVLNLGHTFAHAIETLAQREGKDITHGEAVSIGMVMAAELGGRLACAECGQEGSLAERLRTDLTACGLPVESPFTIDQMAAVMTKDKKAEGGKVHFVVPEGIGNVVVKSLTIEEVVEQLK